jgi:hypothetical protein
MQRCYYISFLLPLIATALCAATSPSSPYIDMTSDSINGPGIGFAFSSGDSMCPPPPPQSYRSSLLSQHSRSLQRQVRSFRPSLPDGPHLQIWIVGRALFLCLWLQVMLWATFRSLAYAARCSSSIAKHVVSRLHSSTVQALAANITGFLFVPPPPPSPSSNSALTSLASGTHPTRA